MRKKYDVIVVGAGPSGSMAARYAASCGVSVLILEKDRDVGYPVRCGEAASRRGVEEFIDPDDKWIAAKISNFSMTAPDGTEVVLPLEEEGFVLERRIFDYALAKSAADEGAEILTRAYVNGLLFSDGKVSGVKFEYFGEQKELNADIVIGADGVESRVGRWAGLKTYTDFRDMESAVQITAFRLNDIDKSTCYFYFGEQVAPQGYFWIFPKGDNIANIGLAVGGAIGKKKSALRFLNDFMEERYPEAAVLTRIAGGVPCVTTLDKITAPGLMLVGDAARQVNPLSGGGIISGMIGGKLAGEVAGNAVKTSSLNLIHNYEKLWRDRLGKRHKIFDRIKNGIYNFSDEKFNEIAHSFASVPDGKRSLGNLFKTALLNNPLLLIDVAKVFMIK